MMVELANTLHANPWFCMPHQADDEFVRNFARTVREQLDPGEAEAIVVAAELEAELLLVDEKRGRRIAIDRGLEVTGLSECLPKPRHGVSYLDVSSCTG